MTDIPMSAIASAMAAEKPATGTPMSRLVYPFYQMGFNQTTVARFLPDKDEANQLPWIEQHTMRFPFGGVINSDHDTFNDVTVSIPAMSTWGRKDKVTESLRGLWDGTADDKLIAKTYYRKVSYLMAAFIVSSPLVEKQEPGSPIRLLKLGKQLHDVIRAGLANGDFEWSPFGTDHGRDFKITKTQQGTWANYSTSAFAYKERPLSKIERDAIERHGLLDLSDFVGVEPDADVIAMVWEMYEASKLGGPFDNAKWGSHFRAFENKFGAAGEGDAASTADTSARQAATGTVREEVVAKLHAKTKATVNA